MKPSFSRILTIVTLGLIAVCASARPAAAQNAFQGNFTLPNEVRWANAVLPAGEYYFSLKSAGLPAQITLSGPNGKAFVLTSATNQRAAGESSSLTIERHGGTRFVREMYLAGLKLHLRYGAPSMPKNERLLAQGPVSTEQVLIAMAKK
jgi:hypothetical protein